MSLTVSCRSISFRLERLFRYESYFLSKQMMEMPTFSVRFVAHLATALYRAYPTYLVPSSCTAAVQREQIPTYRRAFSTFAFLPFDFRLCRRDLPLPPPQSSSRLFFRTQTQTGTEESPWRSATGEETQNNEKYIGTPSEGRGGITAAAVKQRSATPRENNKGGVIHESEGETETFRVDVELTPNPLARKFFVYGTALLPPDTSNFFTKSFSRRDKLNLRSNSAIISYAENFRETPMRVLPRRLALLSLSLYTIYCVDDDSIPLVKSLFEVSEVTSILVAKTYLTIVKTKGDGAWEELERKVRTCIFRHLKAGDIPIYNISLSLGVGTPEPSLGVQQEQPSLNEAATSVRAGAAQSGDDRTHVKGEEESSDSSSSSSTAAKNTTANGSNSQNNEDDEEVEEAIKSLLYMRARPTLLADGGDLEVIRFDADTGIVWVYLKGSCQGCPSSLITVKRGMKQMLQCYIPEVEDVRQCDENGDPLEEEEED